MKETLLTTAEDMDWLFETHLKHRTDRAQFHSAALYGNEDAPETVFLYRTNEPLLHYEYVTAIVSSKARVICDSGIEGWQCKLQENYDDFEEFEHCSDIRRLAERLGYKSAQEAWNDNPTVMGSANPIDFRKV